MRDMSDSIFLLLDYFLRNHLYPFHASGGEAASKIEFVLTVYCIRGHSLILTHYLLRSSLHS
jgi:hypothetical protein